MTSVSEILQVNLPSFLPCDIVWALDAASVKLTIQSNIRSQTLLHCRLFEWPTSTSPIWIGSSRLKSKSSLRLKLSQLKCNFKNRIPNRFNRVWSQRVPGHSDHVVEVRMARWLSSWSTLHLFCLFTTSTKKPEKAKEHLFPPHQIRLLHTNRCETSLEDPAAIKCPPCSFDTFHQNRGDPPTTPLSHNVRMTNNQKLFSNDWDLQLLLVLLKN